MAVNSVRGCLDGELSGRNPDETFLRAPPALADAHARILSFVERAVAEAGAAGVVVPMSGGLDSTLTAMLAAEALGSDRVVGLGLPCAKMDRIRLSEAQTIADGLGIDYRKAHLGSVLDAFETVADAPLGVDGDPTATGNVIARLRMTCAYYVANAESLLVCGTANRSELLLGYVTKYGDGGADLFPLGDLYRTEVRALADHVGLPRRIIDKAPTAGLHAGQTDAEDLGAPYRVLDPLLRRLVDRGERVSVAADGLDVEAEVAARIAARVRETRHKRALPPTPGIPPAGERPGEGEPSRSSETGDGR